MAEYRSVRVRISGRVQGVSYRAWTERRARELHVSGWVRNLPNGNVEAVFSGPPAAVAAILAACREGPRFARVDRVDVVAEVDPVIGPFTVRF